MFFNLKPMKYKLWKRLYALQIYPKDINYYYRLYYATNNLTWFFSLRKQRKIWRLKIFNYIKSHSTLFYKNFISKLFTYDLFNHRVLLHKFMFKKINLFLYYKYYTIKKFIKTRKHYKERPYQFSRTKYLRLFNRIRTEDDKPIFHRFKNNLLRIFKESRESHWTATHKETLNKRTYCNFLPKFIKNQTFAIKTALILILQQIKLTYSWKHSILLVNLFFFNHLHDDLLLKKGTIIQFPKVGLIYTYKRIIKIKATKRLWEQRRRQYLFIQSKKKLWMKKRKNFYKKIEFNLKQASFLQKYYHYDVYTNSLCFLRDINWHLFFLKMQQFSFVLKLTKWRFKA